METTSRDDSAMLAGHVSTDFERPTVNLGSKHLFVLLFVHTSIRLVAYSYIWLNASTDVWLKAMFLRSQSNAERDCSPSLHTELASMAGRRDEQLRSERRGKGIAS